MTHALGSKSGRFVTNASLHKTVDWKAGHFVACKRLKLVVQFERREFAFSFVGLVAKAPKNSQFKVGETYSCFHIEDFERTLYKTS